MTDIAMIQADDLISTFSSRGYTFFTGVPCSFLRPIIDNVIERPDLDYIAASSEGEAIGIAAGAYLAGRKTVVMCQNSGLGNAVNPIASLNFPFRIPTLILVTLRGEPGIGDEPQHELMGQITGSILDTLRVSSAYLPDRPKQTAEALNHAMNEMNTTGLPYALVVKKGTVAGGEAACMSRNASVAPRCKTEGRFVVSADKRMLRVDAIRTIKNVLPNTAAIVATTGKTGRELFTLADDHNHFYMVGSMGCASGLGFGIQYAMPQQMVVVLDGDGAALMKMGTLATIGHYAPSRFVHVVLDNEAYESTGAQFSVSPTVDFCEVASACGYRQCIRADTEESLLDAVNEVVKCPGPSMIHVKVACGSLPGLGRPTVKPSEVRARFMRFLRSRVSP